MRRIASNRTTRTKTQKLVKNPIILATAALMGLPAAVYGHGLDVLVFTKTSGFAHGSIPDGVAAVQALGIEHDFGVTVTNDATVFVNELPNHQVTLFLNTSGNVFNSSQETAFKSWYQSGGGYVGIHAASDTEHDWPWYIELVGAEFDNHPAVQIGTVDLLDQIHPITNVTDPTTSSRVIEWTVSEEWYNFKSNPRGETHVLAHLNERITTSNNDEPAAPGITGGNHGDDHPIAWCQEFDGGRSAYLAMGHKSETYLDPIFRGLIVNSIEWAAGELGGDSGATINANFEKIVLDSNVSNPMSLDIDTTGKVYFVERKGAVKVHDQSTGQTTVIGTLNEYSGGEYGLLGIALAPDFESSRQLFIQWSPANGPNNRLSRFTLDAEGDLDLSSEVVVLEYFTNRNAGHHQSGSLEFDSGGNLFMSLGDNSWASPFAPRGDTPDNIDKSDFQKIAEDGRKGAPNSNDLRGGIIRITPVDGTGPAQHPYYTIPSGNLFPPGTALGRPEIYVMGSRNAFRIAVDPITGWVYYGDVGPDQRGSSTTNPLEGPVGHDEFNQVKGPGWFGWPYFHADNKPYMDHSGNPWTMTTLRQDLASFFLSDPFVDNGGVAGDPNLIPDPQPAWIWYPDGASNAPPQFSEIGAGGGRCAMAGGVYQYASGKNFPAYYDRSVFIMEWSRNRIYDIRTRPDGSILEITRFAPHLSFDRPLEMEFGPDGVMYMIEWGTEFGSGNSSGAQLVKLQYTQAAATPIAVASADVTDGGLPLTVNFSSAGSMDPDSVSLSYAWDFDGDQVIDSTEENPTHIFTTAGTYSVQLTVTDSDLLFSRANLTVSAGNFAPQIGFDFPGNFSFFDWGDVVPFSIWAADAEDGSTSTGEITAADILFEASLGHDDHQHNEVQLRSLSGEIEIQRDSAHAFDQDIGYVFDAFYTDQGAPGVDPLLSSSKTVLQPKVTMAQTYDGASGVATQATSDPVGGLLDVTSIDHGDSIWFDGINLDGIDAIRLGASCNSSGGTVRIRQGSPSGTLIASVPVSNTGDWSSYQDFTANLSGAISGPQALYFIFEASPGSTDLLRLNWINFRGNGAAVKRQLPEISDVAVIAANTVQLTFDQTMDYGTLASPASYSISGGASLGSATPLPDQSAVTLNLSGATADSYFTITLNGLEDLAGDVMPSPSEVVVFNTTPPSSNFLLGVNAGGPGMTDSSGNYYEPDTPGEGTSTPEVTLLVDFNKLNGSGNPVIASTPANFSVGDPNVSGSATVNYVTDKNATNQVLTASGLAAPGITLNEVNGQFSTSKGKFDDFPLLDGYMFESSTLDATATITGLGDIAAGTVVTLTLWGLGDVSDSDCEFAVTYNGASLGNQSTDYEAAETTNLSPAFVTYTFSKVTGEDSLVIQWGRASTATTGFSAFSLTAPGGSTGGTGGGPYFASGTGTFTTNNSISGTTDDLLYQSERFSANPFTYSFPVGNGRYQVLLRFAEIFYTSDGSRVFDVNLENGPSLFSPSGLDVHAVAPGKDASYDFFSDPVDVTDGVLNVNFVPGSANNPKISAIGIWRAESFGSGVPDPSFARFLADDPNAKFSSTTDSDFDGIPTLLEYALGSDPNASDPEILPIFVPDTADDFDFIFDRPLDLPDVSYRIEASATLGGWLELEITPSEDDLGNGLERVTFSNLKAAASAAGLTPDSACFFRMVVTLINPDSN